MTRTELNHCPTCGEILSVKHIICNYLNYRDLKANLEIDDNLQIALGPNPDDIEKIFEFLKLIKLYNLLKYKF